MTQLVIRVVHGSHKHGTVKQSKKLKFKTIKKAGTEELEKNSVGKINRKVYL